MHTLSLRRVRFCKEADNLLRALKSRTGVTPNILCRIGFVLSLDEPGIPNPKSYSEDSDREINRYTLLGEHDGIFSALLLQRVTDDSPDGSQDLNAHFRAHVNRGVILLAGRVKSLPDLLAEIARPRPLE